MEAYWLKRLAYKHQSDHKYFEPFRKRPHKEGMKNYRIIDPLKDI